MQLLHLVGSCVCVCVCETECVCVCVLISICWEARKSTSPGKCCISPEAGKKNLNTLKHTVMLRKKKGLQNYILGVSIFIHPTPQTMSQNKIYLCSLFYTASTLSSTWNMGGRGQEIKLLFFAKCYTLSPVTKITE